LICLASEAEVGFGPLYWYKSEASARYSRKCVRGPSTYFRVRV